MSATATLPPNLAALMAGATPAKPKAKSSTPCVLIREIDEITDAYPGLCAALKDAEAKKDAAAAAIMAKALPHLCEISRQNGAPASSIRVNGLLMVRTPTRTDLRDTAENPGAVAHAMNAFGESFFQYFAPVVKTSMTPDDLMKINAFLDSVQAPCPRITYSLDWTPTPALHAARTLKPEVERLCQSAIPQISPITYVNAK